MKRVQRAIPVIATVFLVPLASAQTYTEIEPNNGKSEATPIVGIVNGNTIGGLTLGADLTLGSTANTTADYYRVKTAALPLGIYKHRLEQPQLGYVSTIRGLDQIGAPGLGGGTVGVADVTAQTAVTTSPLHFNQWFGFGKQEEIYWRILGNGGTGTPYTITFATIPVIPTTIPPTFEAGPITISTVGLTVNDTELHVYDANLNSIAGWSNDDVYPPLPAPDDLNSKLTRTFPPGDYYIAVSRNSTGWNHPSPADDGYVNGVVLDFPNCIERTNNGTQDQTWDFTINAGNGNYFQPNFVPGPAPYEITWWKITVAAGAPIIGASNDNCAAAIDLGVGGTKVGSLQNATHDGLASCDPGGVTSKDVWFKITNPSAVFRTLKADTCGSTADTVLSAYNVCGGGEAVCSDDCGGAPCTATTSSCITMPIGPGQTAVLRISDKGLAGGSLYTLHAAMLFDNDECATPINLAGPGMYPFDTSGASRGIEGQFETLCTSFGVTDIEKDLWYTYTATANGTATLTTCGLLTSPTFDTKIAIYPGAGCPTTGTSIACWDDDGVACAQSIYETTLSWPTTCGSVYTIQLGGYQPTFNLVGNFALTEVGTNCSTPTTPFCLGDGTGASCPCSPTPNNGAAGHGCGTPAFPGGALLSSNGIASDESVSGPAADTLVLTASDIPGPALFIQSNGIVGAIPFGDGQLCAAVGIIRLGVVFPLSGSASYPGGITPNEIHSAGFAAAGQTKHYQAWYRSIPGVCTSGQNYSLTQGLSLVWTN